MAESIKDIKRSWLPERISYDAIGLKKCDVKMKQLLKPTNSFPLISYPNKDEWLARNNEAPQTFNDFIKLNKPNELKIIYLVKIGDFDNISLDILCEYAQIFFGLTFKVLSSVILTQDQLDECDVRAHNNTQQLLTTSIYENILLPIKPDDAMCIVGITNYDLYPESLWNYVFGQVDINLKCGIFSFYQYLNNDQNKMLNNKLLLRRTCQLMVHEIFHLFGVDHCQYFQCVMMGSNSLNEADKQPLELCPVCLHKLIHMVPNYDIIDRYQRLHKFYLKYADEFSQDILWLNQRLSELR